MFTLKVIALKITALVAYIALLYHFPVQMRQLQKVSESMSEVALDQIPVQYAVIMAHGGIQHIVSFMIIVTIISIASGMIKKAVWQPKTSGRARR